MTSPLRVLFLESFYGGSHAAFADGLRDHSRHAVDVISLPAENWKWRARVAALQFARMVPDPDRYDAVVVTDLMNLADLRALWGAGCPPILLYVHESQLSYPLAKERTLDANTALQDIRNCLVADRVLFNSRFHRDGFLERTGRMERRIPADSPLGFHSIVERKSAVVYPGVDMRGLRSPTDRDGSTAGERNTGGGQSTARATGPVSPGNARRVPRVLWNDRWEYDKRPGAFFRVLERLAGEGLEFELVVLGENPQVKPEVFLRARDTFADRIARWGYAEDREEYCRWVRECDIVVSTAAQENFGIATVEAVRAGCIPLLPHRLSYPELIPEEFHPLVLYEDDAGLAERLRPVLSAVRNGEPPDVERLAESMERYSWETLASEYDRELEALAAREATK